MQQNANNVITISGNVNNVKNHTKMLRALSDSQYGRCIAKPYQRAQGLDFNGAGKSHKG
jgi:hypothetical protein